MSTTITYHCDWCGASTSDSRESYDWRHVETEPPYDSINMPRQKHDLCPDCAKMRSDAITNAKAVCTAKRVTIG